MSAATGSRILDALRRVGAEAFLLEDGGKRSGFTASIQPVLRLQTQDAGPLGTGRRKKAVLYAQCNATTRKIKAGSRIAGNGAVYRVLQMDAVRLAGREIYLWAALELEEEI